jgi:hypothetical protein
MDMAESTKEKSLEMRVAELEDKLSKIHISEDEMKAYHKVSSLLGAGQVGAEVAGIQAAPTPTISCVARTCIVRTCIIRTCVISCINCINECTCGPCIAGGSSGAGGGFGSLGM